uniref:Uncharacterized protein n=1 Tax=Arundo donax TaxID=35708 RepID=A0A0A9DV52_ARUDO
MSAQAANAGRGYLLGLGDLPDGADCICMPSTTPAVLDDLIITITSSCTISEINRISISLFRPDSRSKSSIITQGHLLFNLLPTLVGRCRRATWLTRMQQSQLVLFITDVMSTTVCRRGMASSSHGIYHLFRTNILYCSIMLY